MKNKVVLFALILGLIVNLTACMSQNNIDYAPTTSETATEEAANPSVSVESPDFQIPLIAVSMPISTQTETAEDGTKVFTYTQQEMLLTLPEPEIADKVILDFLNRTDLTSEVEQYAAAAKQAYANNPETFSPYWVQSTYTPNRIDQEILSIFGNNASYDGGAHGNFSFYSANYDLSSGCLLSLSDIINTGTDIDQVVSFILDSLSQQAEEKQLFDGYEKIAKDLLSRDFFQSKDWFFTNTGLCFYFAPYEIGPFSSGPIFADIPYSTLTGIIKDQFFPPESDKASGQIIAENFTDHALSQFEQFTELIVDDGGKKILLYCDKTVLNIQIKVGSWSANGSVFTVDHTVFSSNGLSSGSAIMIDAPISQNLPTLLLEYQTGDSVKSYYICISKTLEQILTAA